MNGPHITLTEYGRLHIGELEPSKPSVTLEQAIQLITLKKMHGFDVFKWVNQHTLAAQQYVGTVQVGALTIEILPKIEGRIATSEPVIRRNLVMMLMAAHNIDVSDGNVAHVSTQQYGVLEILIRLFCERLFLQVHRGLVRRYERHEGNFPVLRGKLAISEQLRLNAAHPERLYCRFEELNEDIPLNQILKAGIRLLLKVSRDLSNQRQLRELLLIFESVSDIAPRSLPWNEINFDRLNERYRSAFGLAKLFLHGTHPDITGGRAMGFSLFFDMNALFEEYIGRTAIRAFRPVGVDVRLQGPMRYLALDEETGAKAFAMKPDVIGISSGQVEWIIDCKWKQLTADDSRQGTQQADLYQMYAYANNYRCADVVLLYPHHKALGVSSGIRATYQLQRWAGTGKDPRPARIRIVTVDLSDLSSTCEQLRSVFATHSFPTDSVAQGII